jgi:hypothetical protein
MEGGCTLKIMSNVLDKLELFFMTELLRDGGIDR